MALKLPLSVVGDTDVNRVLRELGGLNDFFISADTRKTGQPVAPPRITYQLQQLARDNKANLLDSVQRDNLREQLQKTLKTSPLLHISFAAEPVPRIIEAVLGWLRSNIHPQALLSVGLQPTIAAGCVLRTPNKIFDMSLRQNLKNQESYLTKLIAGAASGKR